MSNIAPHAQAKRQAPPTATAAIAAVLKTGLKSSWAKVFEVVEFGVNDEELFSSVDSVFKMDPSSGLVEETPSSGVVTDGDFTARVEVDGSSDTIELTATAPPIRVLVNTVLDALFEGIVMKDVIFCVAVLTTYEQESISTILTNNYAVRTCEVAPDL